MYYFIYAIIFDAIDISFYCYTYKSISYTKTISFFHILLWVIKILFALYYYN